MTEPKKRGLFQIHLSTAIVLMFVAGGLLWANFIPRHDGTGLVKGWPYPVLYDCGGRALTFRHFWGGSSVTYAIMNSLEGVAILIASYCLCESAIRRLERRP